MATGPEINCFRLLLLEESPASLAIIRDVWPEAEVTVRALSDPQGLADQVSREKIQVVFCDLVAADSTGFLAIQNIRRVHPHLPLIAVLTEPDLALTLLAFRNGASDVLVRPLDHAVVAETGLRLSHQGESDALQATAQQATRRSLDDLILLKAVGETTNSAQDLQKLLDRIVDLIQNALDVDIVSLMLVDDDGVLKIRSSRGLPEDVQHRVTIAPGEGVAGHVIEHGEPVLIDDLSTDGRFPPRGGVVRYRTGSLLSVPIRYQQQVMGVLNVNNKRTGEAFSGADQELLLTIGHQTALAIENMKLVGRLHEKNLEVERAHADLVKLHQDRTRFVCNLSHELKTPLTSVLGFADLMHNFFEQIDSSRQQEYIQRIYTEGKHLEQLLTGMLRLFSIDSGSEHWQWQNLSLEKTLADVLLKYKARIEEKGLQVKLQLPKDLHEVWGDQDKLELLLDALVDNAVKFNRQDGELTVSGGNLTLHEQSLVYLQVANQGQTVQREDAESIFQEYSQLGELDAGKPSGVGIGLATCRAILRQMQGDIFLEPNEGDVEGTSIALLLPTGRTEMESSNG